MNNEMMIDRSEMFFDCEYVKSVESTKTLFGYWYKVYASYFGYYNYEIECDNSDCDEEFEKMTKCFENAEKIKIPHDNLRGRTAWGLENE